MAAKHPIKDDLTAEYVRSALHYDPETGVFTWRWRADMRPQWNATFAGKVAGRTRRPKKSRTAYRDISINNSRYMAHRLAWLYMTGEWPSERLDHRDNDGLNNRWLNLREATNSENMANNRRQRNNTSGFKGVSWSKVMQLYHAYIWHDGKRHHLGYFNTPEEAHQAYLREAQERFGEFAHAG